MRRTFLIAAAASLLLFPQQAASKLLYHHAPHASRAVTHSTQIRNLEHSRYVCAHGAHANRIWHCKAVRWLTREAAETAPPVVTDWVAKQIAAANWIGANSKADPWPNCPDPFDGRGSWQDTANCENGGNWMDSPGYFRCGLQFDPGWEIRFGRLCP